MKSYYQRCPLAGKMMIVIGLTLNVPLMIILFFPQEKIQAYAFLIPSLVSILLGFLTLNFPGRKAWCSNHRSTLRNSSRLVLFAWGYGILLGAIPLLIGQKMNFVDALFESVSGWTTTGLSVMDVTATSPLFLFHRSFMQFCGGLGFIMMVILLVQEKQAMNLYSAEGHPDRLMPSLKETVKTIFFLYIGFLFAGTMAYVLVGMPLFESLLHAMCSLSTGGFSTRLGSIGEYNNVVIEAVTIVQMLIGTTNFAVLLLVIKGRFHQVIKVSELRLLFILLPLATLLIAASLYGTVCDSWTRCIRMALFDGASALSTTGYSSMSYQEWPSFAIGILILLMLIGGGLGSTAGGIKLNRMVILLKTATENLRQRMFSSRRVATISYVKVQGKEIIDRDLKEEVHGFVLWYLMIYIVGALMLTAASGCTLQEALFEFASCLSTVGLSIGITGPGTSAVILWIEMTGMILGRLEIFIVLTGLVSLQENIAHSLKRCRHCLIAVLKDKQES